MKCEWCDNRTSVTYIVPISRKEDMTVCYECLCALSTSIDYTDEDRVDIYCDMCGEVITDEYVECDDGTCRCMTCIEDTRDHCDEFDERYSELMEREAYERMWG